MKGVWGDYPTLKAEGTQEDEIGVVVDPTTDLNNLQEKVSGKLQKAIEGSRNTHTQK